MAAHLGMEGMQEIPRPGILGKFSWIVGETLILQHVGSIVGAPECCNLEILLEPRPSPESALCLGFPVCKISKITRKCWKRAGA